MAHGVQKLFGWLGGHGLEGTGAAFEQMGFQPGRQSALAAGLGEAGDGLLIALGLATPVAGAAAAATMLPAATVHAPRGFFATGGGYEYPAVLGVSTAALALSGPGDWSLDARFGRRLNQPWMAAAALLVSSAVSLAVVQRRRRVLAARAEQPAASAQNTRYREELVPIREEFVGKKTPADTQVAVSALGRPEWLIEVEAIAVK